MMYEQGEFSEKIVRVSRVSKKTKGGNKIGFSVLVVVGDNKGRVGVGLGKAPEVQAAIRKGVAYAKKHLIEVPMVDGTIPHEVYIKTGAAKLLLKPAYPGTGVIAGGAARAVLEAAGIHDILSKVLGTSNKASNVYATLEALKSLRAVPQKEKKEEKKTEAATDVREKAVVLAKREKKTKKEAKK
ncbi:MAG: 30S ribosomal protein S5 [bacterium]|nr:30S ribosomal protein S5 [bacterium]